MGWGGEGEGLAGARTGVEGDGRGEGEDAFTDRLADASVLKNGAPLVKDETVCGMGRGTYSTCDDDY